MLKNFVDIKVKVWNRAYFSDEANMQEIIDLIKQGDIYSIFDENLGFKEEETMFDTESHLSVEENDGYSTIEVYEDSKIIYKNGGD
jgi:hypothetical protein